jgi:glyoxylase-like metal-dependent hydrolase (beta-lactamase superfamily II)
MPSPVTRVAVPVDTRAPGGTTNAYLVDGLLVDPAARTAALDAAVGVADAEVDDDRDTTATIDAIAVTHAHPDHVGGVATYADLTGAPVFAHAAHIDRFADATGIEPEGTFCGGDAVGEPTGDTAVRAVETPGHAPDHVAFAVGDVLLCGDLAVAEGSVAVGGPGANLRAYLDSLRRARDAGYDRLLPGHGPPISDPGATCQRLVDHRLERERAVLAAVERGAADVGSVVDAAYQKDLTGAEDLARATVVAHLEKLLAEGKIGATWRDRLND